MHYTKFEKIKDEIYKTYPGQYKKCQHLISQVLIDEYERQLQHCTERGKIILSKKLAEEKRMKEMIDLL